MQCAGEGHIVGIVKGYDHRGISLDLCDEKPERVDGAWRVEAATQKWVAWSIVLSIETCNFEDHAIDRLWSLVEV
jgi:hypothetical protein